jgi:hypothetical protein
MATTTDQTRKAGDAIILSGKLGGSDKLFDDLTAWVGALGAMHISDATGLVNVRTDPCVIAAPTLGVPGRYIYSGAPLPVGSYLYEVKVTLPGLADPLTFPNDKTKFKLNIVEALP